jgi:uncharacterized damage-inducible protein DinB
VFISPEVLQQHWAYSVWATNRLLDAGIQLSSEELTRDFKTADGSVLETLAHLFWSETIWLSRFKQVEAPPRPAAGKLDLQALRQNWPVLHDEWRGHLAGVSDTAATLTYKDLKGKEWNQPLWILLFHIVNHSTHHRGQVSGFLRAMGHPPPPLDFVAYHRQLSA